MTLMSSDRARLPTTTPLLRGGDERYAERLLEGPLGGGYEGLLANYTYEEKDSDGTTVARHPYTLAYLLVPESVPVAPELFVRPRSGPESWDGVEDAFAGPRTRIRLESAEVEGRYEIFASEMQDQVRLPPAVLPQLRRLARRAAAGGLRLRAVRRQTLLLRRRARRRRGAPRRPRRDDRRRSQRGSGTRHWRMPGHDRPARDAPDARDHPDPTGADRRPRHGRGADRRRRNAGRRNSAWRQTPARTSPPRRPTTPTTCAATTSRSC